jgi:hypothetical protein
MQALFDDLGIRMSPAAIHAVPLAQDTNRALWDHDWDK